MGIQAEEESFPDEDSVDGVFSNKATSMLPTMWLGAQSGKYVVQPIIWKFNITSVTVKNQGYIST